MMLATITQARVEQLACFLLEMMMFAYEELSSEKLIEFIVEQLKTIKKTAQLEKLLTEMLDKQNTPTSGSNNRRD